MVHIPKFCGKLAFLAALITILLFLLSLDEKRGKAWQLISSDLNTEIAELKHENELLKRNIDDLKIQNLSLKKHLDAYEDNFIALKDAAGNCYQIDSKLAADLPEGLTQEHFEIRQIYRKMLNEKRRWDQYQQAQYKSILEKTVEPHVIEVQALSLENEDNREYFLESARRFRRR